MIWNGNDRPTLDEVFVYTRKILVDCNRGSLSFSLQAVTVCEILAVYRVNYLQTPFLKLHSQFNRLLFLMGFLRNKHGATQFTASH